MEKERKTVELPVLALEFQEPRYGHWDGGKKRGGRFVVDCYTEHPGPGHSIKWGCWELNFWFVTGSGRSWKEAAAIAKNRLLRISPKGTKVEVEYETVEI